MIRKVSLLFILLLTSLLARAQDDILRLSIADIDENQRLISNASAADYWKFHTGHNPNWRAADLDDSSWDAITPNTLTLDMVNEDGILEAWFRLKFELDPSLDSVPLFFHVRNFGQALNVYLNGKSLHQLGQMGNDTLPFQGAVTSDILTFIPAMLASDSTYTIAIRYKHLPLRFPANINEVDGNLNFGFGLVTNNNMVRYRENLVTEFGNELFCTTAIGVITFLIWLFFLYNRSDDTILLISLCVTGFFFLQGWVLLDSKAFSLSLGWYNTARLISQLSTGLIMGLIPLIFAKIFTGTIPRLLWVVIPLVFFRSIASILVIEGKALNIFTPLLFISIVIICVYYVVKAWKHLKRPQWAVVIGVLLFLLCVFISSVLIIYFPDIYAGQFTNLIAHYLTILSFPFSLLIYVVMRFGESQEEVRNNAAEVVKVTEEKRQLALAQQVILEKQVKERTEELSQSLDHLKSTQSQLIQAEKMASLGELTAGIAHEIQNPLNFVNNFSDVNTELIDELVEEIENKNYSDALEIAQNIKGNEQKIKNHGGRADSIVKGMLQHSRNSSGEKVPTNINELADEYLRLAYHGLRAKDSTFNAAFETHFDQKLPKVEVIPQDIGRVLLNLINNAFQAVNEKHKSSVDGYAPKVEVSTSQEADHIQVVVKDNGLGIPDDFKDKIFQPFFTTKPTGQGTGLGLSLSYDIIKAHGGVIIVQSEVGKGTEFVLNLPIV